MSLARKYQPKDDDQPSQDDQFLDVEKVVNVETKRTGGKGRQLALIKWSGQSWGKCTWERLQPQFSRRIQEFKQRGLDPEDLQRLRRDDP